MSLNIWVTAFVNAVGKTAEEMAHMDMVLDFTADMDLRATKVFYSKEMVRRFHV